MKALERLIEARVIPVLRGDDPDRVREVAGALVRAGFGALEVTFTVPDAAGVMAGLVREHPGVLVGAGTVTTAGQAEASAAAGAAFLIGPGSAPAVGAVARSAGLPYLPGVLTPTEIMTALDEGWSTLKLFPAELGGPGFLRALRAPFPGVRFMPTGGVTVANIGEWAAAGAVAVGMGGGLVKGSLAEIEAVAGAALDAAQAAWGAA